MVNSWTLWPLVVWILTWQLATALTSGDYRLVWSDEFNDQDVVDEGKWSVDSGSGHCVGTASDDKTQRTWLHITEGYSAGQQQRFSASNVLLRDGALVVSVTAPATPRSDGNGKEGTYTSGRLSTFRRADFIYGRVEAAISLPSGAGLWPSLWLVPSEGSDYGEIDIVEAPHLADGGLVQGTLRFQDDDGKVVTSHEWPYQDGGCTYRIRNQGYKQGLLGVAGLVDTYHVYAMEWSDDEFKWYVDGWHYCTKTASEWRTGFLDDGKRRTGSTAPFDQAFHLMVGVVVGGSLVDGGGVEAPSLPAEMKVDYIRVYQDEEGIWWNPSSGSSSVLNDVLAACGIAGGCYMAIFGTHHFGFNTFWLGFLVGAFKAAALANYVNASDAVIVSLAMAAGMLIGYLSVHHEPMAKFKTIAALSLTLLCLAVDIGLAHALRSRLVIWTVFSIAVIPLTLVVYPTAHHYNAFMLATALTGGAILKLGLGRFLRTAAEMFKIFDDPLHDYCVLQPTCQALVGVWMAVSALGLACQIFLSRRASHAAFVAGWEAEGMRKHDAIVGFGGGDGKGGDGGGGDSRSNGNDSADENGHESARMANKRSWLRSLFDWSGRNGSSRYARLAGPTDGQGAGAGAARAWTCRRGEGRESAGGAMGGANEGGDVIEMVMDASSKSGLLPRDVSTFHQLQLQLQRRNRPVIDPSPRKAFMVGSGSEWCGDDNEKDRGNGDGTATGVGAQRLQQRQYMSGTIGRGRFLYDQEALLFSPKDFPSAGAAEWQKVDEAQLQLQLQLPQEAENGNVNRRWNSRRQPPPPHELQMSPPPSLLPAPLPPPPPPPSQQHHTAAAATDDKAPSTAGGGGGGSAAVEAYVYVPSSSSMPSSLASSALTTPTSRSPDKASASRAQEGHAFSVHEAGENAQARPHGGASSTRGGAGDSAGKVMQKTKAKAKAGLTDVAL